MKTSHITALAILASAAASFNAYAESAGNDQLQSQQKFVSTLSRAQVQAEAVQANRENYERGYNPESGGYLIGSPVITPGMGLTREAVRAEALQFRKTNPVLSDAS